MIEVDADPISDVMMMQRYIQTRNTADIPCHLFVSGTNSGGSRHQSDVGVVTERARPKTRQPPLYRVVLHNDDYTPMEFVVEVLLTYFSLTREQAVQIMLTVHTRGKGIAGTFACQIAETKVALVNDYARAHQQPLLCTMEQA